MRTLWVVVVWLLSGQFVHADSVAIRVLKVCEVIQDLKIYDQKIVMIRAVVISGRHGTFLVDEDGSKSSATCLMFPVSMSLRVPGSELLEGESPVDFMLDDQSEALLNGMPLSRESQTIATLTGQVFARIPFQLVRNRAYVWVGNGFGQGGVFPAQFVVKTVHSVVTRTTGGSGK